MKIADELGCDKIATGHYARIVEQGDHIYLRKAKDEQKDQTYFLWMLTEENLRRTIFPLGDYTKSEVRAIAAQRGFVELSEQKESQDICFVPDGDYRGFILEEAARMGMNVGKAFEAGDYIDANGKVVGKHCGFANYTIGQRKGLGIALGEPAYVSKIDAQNNVVQLMQHDELLTNEVRLTNTLFTGNQDECVEAKIRYRSRAVRGMYENGVVHFQEPVWGVTPGQSVVMYQEDRLVGGGIIR
jgi:tRNA-specific 2-thiouridylase